MNFWGWMLVLVVLGTAINLLPGYVAYRRKHPNTPAIFLTAFLLGWTVIGWAVAMIWAVLRHERRETVAG